MGKWGGVQEAMVAELVVNRRRDLKVCRLMSPFLPNKPVIERRISTCTIRYIFKKVKLGLHVFRMSLAYACVFTQVQVSCSIDFAPIYLLPRDHQRMNVQTFKLCSHDSQCSGASAALQPLAMSLSLNCLIYGEVQDKMFTVEVEKTKNVSILKNLIKEEKARYFNHIDASDLDLFQVSIPMDELGAEPVHVNLDAYQKLSPRKKLSYFFNGTLDDERLHIIAKAPGMSHQFSSWNRI